MKFVRMGPHNDLFFQLLQTAPEKIVAMVDGQKIFFEQMKAEGKLLEGYWTPGFTAGNGLCITIWELDSAEELDRITLQDPAGALFTMQAYPVTPLTEHFKTALPH